MNDSAKKMMHDPEMKKMIMDSLGDFEGEEREKLRKIYGKITDVVDAKSTTSNKVPK